ncbi:MAG: WD40 repeat domain-containing protein, partial [Acidobacteriota bacterium]|nr:WD40 repeat domain-containing protein [Acidobacteriota bacterium]
GIPEPRELDLPKGDALMALSSRGELALSLGPWNLLDGGLLGRSSLAGGPPREVLERVVYADWQPDGSALAVVRRNGPEWRIEYPIGKSLYKTANLILGMRLSPNGERLAFVELVQNEALLSTIAATDGKKVLAVIGKGTFYCPALSWSPNGREIWFSSFDTEKAGIVLAVGLDGKQRTVATLPGQNRLFDISRDGKMLLTTSNQRLGILYGSEGEPNERDLSWLDTTLLSSLGADGKTIVFSEIGEGGGHNRSIYRRSTDGSPAVRLAEGIAGAVSPDEKWVTAYRANAKQKVSLVPIGPGEEIPVLVDGLEDRLGNVVAWLPDGHRYLVRGHQPGKQGRIFVWDSTSRKLTAVSPEGTAFNDLLPAPDGSRFLAQGPDGNWFLYQTDGGAPRPLPGIGTDERPVNWDDDGKSVYLTGTTEGAKSFRVSRLDLATSRKVFWKEIKPAKPVDSVFNLRITPDGRSYAYNYSRTLSDLYVVEGL